MEIMYVKYVNGKRHSIIKEGQNVILNDSKILPFNSVKDSNINKSNPYLETPNNNTDCNLNDKVNNEITNFFFSSIHKNYLAVRKDFFNKI